MRAGPGAGAGGGCLCASLTGCRCVVRGGGLTLLGATLWLFLPAHCSFLPIVTSGQHSTQHITQHTAHNTQHTPLMHPDLTFLQLTSPSTHTPLPQHTHPYPPLPQHTISLTFPPPCGFSLCPNTPSPSPFLPPVVSAYAPTHHLPHLASPLWFQPMPHPAQLPAQLSASPT